MPLVCKAHSYPIAGKRSKSLDEAIVELDSPFAPKKLAYLVVSNRKLGAVAPMRIVGVNQHHAIRITGIPGIFSQTHFLRSGLCGEW